MKYIKTGWVFTLANLIYYVHLSIMVCNTRRKCSRTAKSFRQRNTNEKKYIGRLLLKKEQSECAGKVCAFVIIGEKDDYKQDK